MGFGQRSAFCTLTLAKEARRWHGAMLGLALAAGVLGFTGLVPASAAVPASAGASLSSTQVTQSTLTTCNGSWNIVASPSPGGVSEFNAVSAISASDICCLLYTSPSPRDLSTSRMPSSA